MLILLTNDDGIHAPGLLALYRELVKLGEVHVIAPETVQSATGHGITITTPLLTERVTIENGFTGTAVAGRPADCVKLAVAKLLPRQPDLVVSGMNSGANVGINVLYSGTVAAAIEAGFLGLPSIAVSLYLKSDVPLDFVRPAVFGRLAVERILANGLGSGQVANVNIPPLRPDQSPAGIKVCRQCTRPWADSYDARKDPRGRDYFWMDTVYKLGETDADTDVAALRDGYVTITPLYFDLTENALLKTWAKESWRF